YLRFILAAIVVSIIIPVVIRAAIPAVVVRNLAVAPIPVTFKIPLPVMVGFYPMRARVCRSGPVSLVPLIVVAHRVPIAGYPGMIGAGASWLNPDYPLRRRRADSHSGGKLSESSSHRQQRQDDQFSFHDSTPLLSIPLCWNY